MLEMYRFSIYQKDKEVKEQLKVMHLKNGDARIKTRLCLWAEWAAMQSVRLPFLHTSGSAKRRNIYGELQSNIQSTRNESFPNVINKSTLKPRIYIVIG